MFLKASLRQSGSAPWARDFLARVNACPSGSCWSWTVEWCGRPANPHLRSEIVRQAQERLWGTELWDQVRMGHLPFGFGGRSPALAELGRGTRFVVRVRVGHPPGVRGGGFWAVLRDAPGARDEAESFRALRSTQAFGRAVGPFGPALVARLKPCPSGSCRR